MSSIPIFYFSGLAIASDFSKLRRKRFHLAVDNRSILASESVRRRNSDHDFILVSSNKLRVQCPTYSHAACKIPVYTSELVSDKLRRLVSEFESLLEPIDRVKRLLHYAANLAPTDKSIRLPENRVRGCATQVWLEVKMDEFERVRFKADSDSEIAKGYCSCLIWMLNGAKPVEVLEMRSDDLDAMNLGLHGKAKSRVNTWQNVLISMQTRTNDLISMREAKPPLEMESISSLFVIADGIIVK